MGKARRLSAVGIYHIYLRGNSRYIVFYDDEDYHKFCICIGIAQEKHNAKIYAYVLMDNHIHMLVKCTVIDKFMSSIMVRYVMWYNRKYKLSGRLFQSPFSSAAKNSYEKIQSTIVYILQNPIKAQMCKAPGDHKWSSYNMYFRHCGGNSNAKKLQIINNRVDIDATMVEEMFESKELFDAELCYKYFGDNEIIEKNDSWKRISHSELCCELKRLLRDRVLADLSREDLKIIARALIHGTTASYGQIASLLHVCYEFVRKQR